MRYRHAIALFFCLMVPVGRVWAQGATITGRVVDGATGAPLPDAHVFVSGLTLGSVTDADGRYELERVPPGAREIAVSLLGYRVEVMAVAVEAGTTLTLDLALTAQPIEMEGIEVVALTEAEWKRYLERFERAFLGTSRNARDCTIRNTEELDFVPRDGSAFEARAGAPLVIDNRALGYRLTYHLLDFTVDAASSFYAGVVQFEEMLPPTERQQQRWERAREEAYLGSRAHFLATLQRVDGREALRAEGFVAYLSPNRLPRPPEGALVDPGTIVADSLPGTKLLHYKRTLRVPGLAGRQESTPVDNYLWVVYTKERESRAYARTKTLGRRERHQTSFLKLPRDAVAIDAFGYPYEPYALLNGGYWAFERIGEMLPVDYVPGGD